MSRTPAVTKVRLPEARPRLAGPHKHRQAQQQRQDQRLEYCGALRAFFRPAFFRSLILASLVRKPSRLSAGRLDGSTSISALAMPSRSAPAWPVTPPPLILATTSNCPSAPSVTSGSLISC